MAKVKIKGGQTFINCPACKTTHCLNTDADKKPCWGFNGDMDKPTFSPSILERSGHYCERGSHPKTKDECEACKEGYDMCYICHSFVKDGMIQFLNDCTHAYAGKTLPLEDIE